MLPQRRQSPTTGIARELFCKRTARPHWRPIGNILNVYLSIVSAEPWSKEAKGPRRRFLSNMFGQSSQLIGSIYLNLYMYTRGRASEGRTRRCVAFSAAASTSPHKLRSHVSAAVTMPSRPAAGEEAWAVGASSATAEKSAACTRFCMPSLLASSRVDAAPWRPRCRC